MMQNRNKKTKKNNLLENFVQKHREAFDDQEPNSQLWLSIKQDLTNSTSTRKIRTVPITRVWQVAAVFLILLVVSLVLQRQFLIPEMPSQKITKVDVTEIYRLNPELAETEQFYIQQIQLKQQEIRQYNFTDTEFETDLQQLEELYDQLKTDLVQSGNSEQVLSAMIQNLQLRSEILNRQIEILEQLQQFNNENHDTKSYEKYNAI